MKKKAMIFATISSMLLAFAIPAFATEAETESGLIDKKAKVTVDLSDGWFAEFEDDAVYLYVNEKDEDFAGSAMLLDEDAFKELEEEAQKSKSYKEYARSFSYVDMYGAENHFYSLAPDVYLVISVEKGNDADEVTERISVELVEAEETETETETE